MKYIVVELDGKETIFIFPKIVDHDRMAEALEYIRFGDEHNWKRRIRTQGNLVSAGFVEGGKCVGRSETLDLDSRPDKDTALLDGSMPVILGEDEDTGAPVIEAKAREAMARAFFEQNYSTLFYGGNPVRRGADGKYMKREAEAAWTMFMFGIHHGSR